VFGNYCADRGVTVAGVAVYNIDGMPSGFFDTGVPWQLRLWDLSITDEIMTLGDQKFGPANMDGKWTLPVKWENNIRGIN